MQADVLPHLLGLEMPAEIHATSYLSIPVLGLSRINFLGGMRYFIGLGPLVSLHNGRRERLIPGSVRAGFAIDQDILCPWHIPTVNLAILLL